MVQTTSTRQQSDAIRAEMRRIRTELPYDVDAARVQVKQLTNWKYHLRQHPLPILSAAALIGYLVVPSRMMSHTVFVTSDGSEPAIKPITAKQGVIAGLFAAAGSIALRSGTSLIMRHISQQLMGVFDPANRPIHDASSLHADQPEFSSESKTK